VAREECRVARDEGEKQIPSLCFIRLFFHSTPGPTEEQTGITEIFYENLSYLLLNMLQSPTLDPHGGLQRSGKDLIKGDLPVIPVDECAAQVRAIKVV
jgi:hypothetical protein